MEITIPLEDGPHWMEGLVFTRDGDRVAITARKTSGSDYGTAYIDKDKLVTLMSVLGLAV